MKRNSWWRILTGISLVSIVGMATFAPAYQYLVRAEGASLDLSPNTASVGVNKTVTVRVVLNSGGGVGVNAADGTVSFDSNFLSVANVQKENSVFNLWTSDPAFSNSKGTVTFSSGSPTPYTKSGGALLSIVFKGVKEGKSEISFSGGSVLAADGQGTNVIGGTGKATITVTAGSTPPPAAEPDAAPAQDASAASGGDNGAPISVDITSPTHPDPEKWYSKKTTEFRWKIPPDVSGASAILSESQSAVPPRVSEGLIDSKRFEDVGDGAWYFSVRFKSSGGSWSQPTRRKAQVDTTAPESLSVDVKNEDPDAAPSLSLSASDRMSGVDRFEVKLDDRDPMSVMPAQIKDGILNLNPVLPGDHAIKVKVFDKAGNVADASRQFSVPGRPMPEMGALGGAIGETDFLIARGRADHDARVFVKIESAGKVVSEEMVKADENGDWMYVHSKLLRPGSYDVSARMVTKAGAESGYTTKQQVDVLSAPFIERFGWILIALFIAVIAGHIWYIRNQKHEHMKRMEAAQREVNEVKFKTQAVFAALNEEAEEKIQLLDEARATQLGVPKLTPADLLDKFRDALDISEDTLSKEVEDIEKTLL